MTTKVIVRSPKNNHLAVNVQEQSLNADGEVSITANYPIPDGEERSFYVYKGRQLLITEVPKP